MVGMPPPTQPQIGHEVLTEAGLIHSGSNRKAMVDWANESGRGGCGMGWPGPKLHPR